MDYDGTERDRLRDHNALLLRLALDQRRKAHDLDAALRGLTEAAAGCLGLQRVGVWELDPEADSLTCRNRYDADAKTHGGGHALTAEGFPVYFEALHTEQILGAEDLRMDRRMSEFVPAYAHRRGTVARLDVPILVDGKLRGVIMHEVFGPARLWTEDERRLASSLTEIAALAMAAHDEHVVRQQLDDLLAAGSTAWLVVGRDRVVVRASAGATDLLGRPRAELVGSPLDAVLPGVEMVLAGEDPVDDEAHFGNLSTETEDSEMAERILDNALGLPVHLAPSERVRTHALRGDGHRRDVDVAFREVRHGGRDQVLVLVRAVSVLADVQV